VDMLDLIAISALDNFDLILQYSPYSTDIVIERNSKDGQFGYETITKEKEFVSVGIIKYARSRRFLEKIGIFIEPDAQSLPLIGLFLNADKFKKGDIIKQITKDFVDSNEIDIQRRFEVLDVKTFGDLRTGKKVFLLAPVRGENKL